MKTLLFICLLSLNLVAYDFDTFGDDSYSTPDYRNGSNSPKIIAPDGTYRGNLNNNKYDPNSVNNPYGKYGSPYSSDSTQNPYGNYGNKYSPNYSNPYGR